MQVGTGSVKRAFFIGAFCAVIAAAARLPWNGKAPAEWTAEEAEQIMNNSPWAQPADATFPDPRDHDAIPAQALPGPAQAGMASARGATDGRWDGGVGYNRGGALPTIQVLVRWDSAEVVKEAQARLKRLGKTPDVNFPDLPSASSDYILTVVGLVPAKNAEGVAKLDGQSSSENPPAPAPNPERLLEDFMSNSTLANRNGQSIRPINVQVDAASGAIRLYFPRSIALDTKVKEAYFSTRYGALTVKKRFRLNDLTYKKRLQL